MIMIVMKAVSVTTDDDDEIDDSDAAGDGCR